ncbi:MAG: TRAP transporter large permease subunit, partial [Oscillospiraceae bacterium]|nr:TRAP transporter large permease subunit [Oscillospiraceae bacterium]
ESKRGVLFGVGLGAVVAAIILYVIFRKENSPVEAGKRTEVKNYFPSYMLLLTVLLLIAASFFPNRPSLTNGIICTVLMIACVVQNYFRTKTLKGFTRAFTEIDFETCLLLLGLFIVVGGITAAGVVDAIARLFAKVGNGNVFLIYTIVVWASVIISAFIDNIPYVATMLPVMQGLASEMGLDPTVLYFGLLIGATLGGNLTPVGASANITGIGMLRKEGCEVRNTDFMKIGVPFTLAAVVTGYLFVWFFYGV